MRFATTVLRAVLDAADSAGVRVVLTRLSLPGARWRQHNGDRSDFRLYRDPGALEQAQRCWADLAAACAGHPALIGYDLLNEPHPSRAHPPAGLSVREVMRRLLAAVRSRDSTAWVIVEPDDFASPDALEGFEPCGRAPGWASRAAGAVMASRATIAPARRTHAHRYQYTPRLLRDRRLARRGGHGRVCFAQSFGALPLWRPRVQLVVTDGASRRDGTFVASPAHNVGVPGLPVGISSSGHSGSVRRICLVLRGIAPRESSGSFHSSPPRSPESMNMIDRPCHAPELIHAMREDSRPRRHHAAREPQDSSEPERGPLEHSRRVVHTGRRVASRARGVTAPTRETAWNLRDEGGSRVAPGVDLVRAAGGGRAVAQRVVVLP